ncbi:MAG: protease modulator HflK [Oleiphilus sp.]
MALLTDLGKILNDNKRALCLIWLVVLPAIYLLSGFYSIGPEQRGILSRFGKIIDDKVLPGMHYHLPWPIETVEKIQATSVRSMALDMVSSSEIFIQQELTTGDQNLLELKLVLQYTVEEPGIFRNQSHDPEQLLKEIASAEVIHYIASKPINDLLTTGRIQFQNQLKKSIQQQARMLHLGMRLTAIQIKKLKPPSSIEKTFDQASIARSEKNKMIQTQKLLRNSRLAKARGEATALRQSAQASVAEMTEKAEGHRANFLSNLAEYQANPQQVIQQSQLTTLKNVLNRATLIVVPAQVTH